MKFIYSHQLKNKLYRYALKLINDCEDAKDIAQDVFEKLLQKQEPVNNHRSYDALAIKMVRDLCYDRIRHQSIKQEKLDLIKNNNSNLNPTNYDLKDTFSIIEKLTKTLPEKQQVIFQLRDIQELEFEEIARLLDMDETAIRMNLSRARKTIREQLIKIQNYGL